MTAIAPTLNIVARFEELSAALVAGSLKPSPRSPLRSSPPSGALGDSSLVENGRLRPGCEAVMETLADPAGRLVVVLPHPTRAGRITLSLYWRRPGGPLVLSGERADGLDLTLLPTLNDAAVWLDQVLSLTAFPAATTDTTLRLTLAGYAALLAVADAIESARLRHRLERSVDPALAPQLRDVEEAFSTGLEVDDQRWAVSAARGVCPADLRAAHGHIDSGIGELTARGLVAPTDDGRVGLTKAGAPIVAAFTLPVRVAGVARALAADGVSVCHVTVHRSVVGIWLALWQELGATPHVTLIETSSARAAVILADLIRESPPD